MNETDIKQNPHPKQRYEITMTIDGAPGPFESVTGKMGYEVINHDCVPKDPISGGSSPPESTPPIVFKQINSDTYQGILYLDLLQDENYFGLGVCHWKMTDAFMDIRVNGVSMGSDIDYDKIIAQQSVTQYMAKELYHGSTVKDLNVSAVPVSDYVAKNKDKFFSITISAKALEP